MLVKLSSSGTPRFSLLQEGIRGLPVGTFFRVLRAILRFGPSLEASAFAALQGAFRKWPHAPT